ncbi:hypothetical protein [Amycolatopsis sp. lyj-112]|uniref:hypothetical protein n=1 Tax=Amycolatopsis sp. lyj-112 TaxID=2789288 RepID=UPI003977FBFC
MKSVIMKRVGAITALPVTAVLAFGGTSVADTAPSFTPAGISVMGGTCDAEHHNYDSGSGTLAEDAARRPGPGTNCGTFGTIKKGKHIQYHCEWASWTHGRVDGTNQNGWFYSAKLDDGGSNEKCAR